jgi:hypothetical protein
MMWQRAAVQLSIFSHWKGGAKVWVIARAPEVGLCSWHHRRCRYFTTQYAFQRPIRPGYFGAIHVEDVELLADFQEANDGQPTG